MQQDTHILGTYPLTMLLSASATVSPTSTSASAAVSQLPALKLLTDFAIAFRCLKAFVVIRGPKLQQTCSFPLLHIPPPPSSRSVLTHAAEHAAQFLHSASSVLVYMQYAVYSLLRGLTSVTSGYSPTTVCHTGGSAHASPGVTVCIAIAVSIRTHRNHALF